LPLKAGKSSDFGNSMAKAMQEAFKAEWLAVKEEPLPQMAEEYLRPLFVAISQGVVKHLSDEASDSIKIQEHVAKSDFQNSSQFQQLLSGEVIKEDVESIDYVFFNEGIKNETALREKVQQAGIVNADPIVALWQKALKRDVIDQQDNNRIESTGPVSFNWSGGTLTGTADVTQESPEANKVRSKPKAARMVIITTHEDLYP
jgi:hypothetical protein